MQKIFRLPLVLVFTLIFLMLIFNTAGLYWHLEFPFSRWLSLLVSILAISVVLSAAYAFKKAQTTFDPRTPEKSTSLVVSGIFYFSRNPMYLGFLLFLLSAAIYSGNLFNFLFLPLFVLLANRWYIKPEEIVLKDLFGQEYLNYINKVRRWI